MRIGRGCGCLIALIAIFLFVVIGILVALRTGYVNWQSSFESKHLSTDYTYFSGEKFEATVKSLEEKIKTFSASKKKTDFVEFNTQESIVLIGQEFASALPEYLKLNRMYLEPSKNAWLLYFQVKYNDFDLPWVTIKLEKDNIETPQLFITEIKVGPYSLDDFGLKSVRGNINSGIQEAIILVNENQFTGRKFINIDLDEKGMIVKGELNGN